MNVEIVDLKCLLDCSLRLFSNYLFLYLSLSLSFSWLGHVTSDKTSQMSQVSFHPSMKPNLLAGIDRE